MISLRPQTRRIGICALILLCLAIAPARPNLRTEAISEIASVYDLYVGGFWVAEIRLDATIGPEGYSAEGEFQTKGVIGWFDDTHLKANTVGRVGDGVLSPIRYRSNEREDDDQQVVEVSYSDRGPVTVVASPELKKKPWSIDVRDQSGTIDPLSAILMVLNPVSPDEVCSKRVDAFDGRKRFAFDVGQPERRGDRVVCRGTYLRLAGFKPKTLESRGRQPFVLYLRADKDGGYMFERLVSDSGFGAAVITLRD